MRQLLTIVAILTRATVTAQVDSLGLKASLTPVMPTQAAIPKQPKKSFENYYAPWHQIINDTAKWRVSKLGIYVSFGLGYPHDYKYSGIMPFRDILSTSHIIKYNGYYGAGGLAKLASYSIAYKSHILSISNGYTFAGTYATNSSGYSSNYIGLLMGESIRCKHLMISLSAGVASTNLFVQGITFYKKHTILGNQTIDRVTSFPIELKAFYLARNGIGIGIHITEDIVPVPKYSPFYACISVVFGFWNIPKK